MLTKKVTPDSQLYDMTITVTNSVPNPTNLSYTWSCSEGHSGSGSSEPFTHQDTGITVGKKAWCRIKYSFDGSYNFTFRCLIESAALGSQDYNRVQKSYNGSGSISDSISIGVLFRPDAKPIYLEQLHKLNQNKTSMSYIPHSDEHISRA